MTTGQQAPFRITHDGIVLEGSILSPAGSGPHPAVVMFPGATGAGKTFWKTARQLTDLGYLTVGIDMYGVDADISTPETAGAYFAALLEAPAVLRSRIVTWFEAVCAREDVDGGRVAAIGYCFGGKCVLELARSGAAVRSVTSFHGLLKTHAPASPGAVSAKVAVWTGGQDPYAPLEDFDALRNEFDAAGVDYQATLFARAQHSFTDPDHDGIAPGIAYDRQADSVSWAGTLALIEHSLG